MSDIKPVEKLNSKGFKYSNKVHVSYGLGGFLDNFFIAAFTVRIIDFYENELLLGVLWVGLAFVIFGFWNAVNDPILGFLSDKKTKLTEKYGRRFPWFMIGALSYSFIYLLIFMVPFQDQLGMFFWLVITICAFELLFSLWQINWLSLFPDKFRSAEERTRIGAWTTIWGVMGIALGVLIPPLLIEYGDVGSYVVAGVVVTIIGFISAIFALYGMREDKELIEQQLVTLEKLKDQDSFVEKTKFAVKDKNFMAYVITYLGHQVLTVMMLSSLPYWNKYIIGSADSDLETIMSAGFLVAVLASVPVWAIIGKKLGNKKAYMLGTLITTFLFLPFFFISDLILTTLSIAFIGVGIGAIWVLMYPGFSDVIDDIVVKTGMRQEGSYTGIRTFFGRLSIVIQAASFAIIHIITGYNAEAPIGADTQSAFAQFGIRFLMAGIPMIFYFMGFLLMWKVYDLDLGKVESNKKTIIEEQL